MCTVGNDEIDGKRGKPPSSTDCNNSSVRCRRFAVRRCQRDEEGSSLFSDSFEWFDMNE